MPIAVDICNSLADINGQLEKKFSGYCNSTYPFPIPAEYFTSPGGMRVFWDADPFPETARLLNNLAELFGNVIYVTTRPKVAKFITKRWLMKHGYPNGEIVFCYWKEKTEVYDSLAPHLIIEDDPRVIETAIGLNTSIIVPQWPYNSHIKGGKIVPVSWTGICTAGAKVVSQWG